MPTASPAMNAMSTAAALHTDDPKTVLANLNQTVSKISAEEPDRKNIAEIRVSVFFLFVINSGEVYVLFGEGR